MKRNYPFMVNAEILYGKERIFSECREDISYRLSLIEKFVCDDFSNDKIIVVKEEINSIEFIGLSGYYDTTQIYVYESFADVNDMLNGLTTPDEIQVYEVDLKSRTYTPVMSKPIEAEVFTRPEICESKNIDDDIESFIRRVFERTHTFNIYR